MIPSTTASAASPTSRPGIDVTIDATGPVQVAAIVDGTQQAPTTLRPGESVSFMAQEQLVVTATDGGAVRVTVDGQDFGVPGSRGEPWARTFGPVGSS